MSWATGVMVYIVVWWTVLFAVLIGPLVHVCLPLLDTARPRRTRATSDADAVTRVRV